jgi:hypothetical protein
MTQMDWMVPSGGKGSGLDEIFEDNLSKLREGGRGKYPTISGYFIGAEFIVTSCTSSGSSTLLPSPFKGLPCLAKQHDSLEESKFYNSGPGLSAAAASANDITSANLSLRGWMTPGNRDLKSMVHCQWPELSFQVTSSESCRGARGLKMPPVGELEWLDHDHQEPQFDS